MHRRARGCSSRLASESKSGEWPRATHIHIRRSSVGVSLDAGVVVVMLLLYVKRAACCALLLLLLLPAARCCCCVHVASPSLNFKLQAPMLHAASASSLSLEVPRS
jgi:hypothetical protein